MRTHSIMALVLGALLVSVRVLSGAPDTDAELAATELAHIQDLLKAGGNIEERDERGWTPLIFAISRTNLSLIKTLVAKGADVNAMVDNAKGNRVLDAAVQSDDLDIVKFLLTKGARVNGRARNGCTALYLAVIKRRLDIARFLLDGGADPNAYAFRDEGLDLYTPLIAAACTGQLPMVELLCDRGARLEQRNARGSTALMEVAKRPHHQVVQWLIRRGANVNATGPQGHTALLFAAYNGQTENIQLLLAAGADPLAQATDAVYPDEGWTYDAAKLAQQEEHPDALAVVLEAQKRARR